MGRLHVHLYACPTKHTRKVIMQTCLIAIHNNNNSAQIAGLKRHTGNASTAMMSMKNPNYILPKYIELRASLVMDMVLPLALVASSW